MSAFEYQWPGGKGQKAGIRKEEREKGKRCAVGGLRLEASASRLYAGGQKS
jgi:hypothetical protein